MAAMDLPVNRFKQALRGGSVPVGTWLMSAAPAPAEALGSAGLDFLVVDTEHVPLDLADTVAILRAIAGTPAAAITRVAWNDQVLVKRLLDAGAQSIMFPFVQSAEEARRAVSYTRYPPDGVRGVAAMHRASRYGTVPDYLKRANAEVCVVVQLETPAALDALPDIVAVDGVDSIFVGPADLSAAMGHLGDIAHPGVQAQLERAARECRRLGKPCGIVGPNPDMVRRFLGYGYSWVAVGSDMSMLLGRAQEWVAQVRDAAATAPAVSP
jgi:2-dehydro-3-deoxyglucarate aldolase/4-hydroxy-2-oxoheptanedioate aldolase